jgi:hypothetical protein
MKIELSIPEIAELLTALLARHNYLKKLDMPQEAQETLALYRKLIRSLEAPKIKK